MLKSAFCIVICLFLLQAQAQSLLTIKGVVKDSKGETLPGAKVFLSNTKLITSTDNNGKFHLNGISAGSYLVVAKYIGYQTYSASVNVIDQSLDVNINLKENTNRLSQVTISADPKWEDHFQEFKKRFLGTTPNAKKCKIENKEVLHFRYSSKTNVLTASADEFLKIRNDAMGYEISYSLESFEFNEKNGILKYQGYPSFEELKPADDRQSGLWQKNRSEAYAGSPTHLMKSVFEGSSYKQGFRIYSCDYDPLNPDTEDGQAKPIQVFSKAQVFLDSLIRPGNDNFKILSFKRSLFVVYTKAKETFDYEDSGYAFKRPYGISMIPYGQLTIISPLDGEVAIDSKGNFNPPDALLFKGFMAWKQIADLTPIEYSSIIENASP